MIEVLFRGQASGPSSPFTREEHIMKEASLARGKRTPRRAQTQHEYFLPSPHADSAFTFFQQPPTPQDSPRTPSTPAPAQQREAERSRPRRPPLGPPRRSYSVTDQQPIPRRHPSAAGLALTDLPSELHFAIFDFLDPIDSTCLGLTNKHFYAIHRRLHGTVPLTARRAGPNDLEWAWHLAGNIVRNNPAVITADDASKVDDPAAAALIKGLGEKEKTALSKLRVRGQGYCRMCGVTRCQLHKHVQEWMGEGLEYCSVREKFGPVAPEGSKSYCYMSRPGDRRRCGRHGRGGKVGGKVELR
ncbi:hypothetical protein VTI74DRAFT_10436 [Chaetomium olivicolor]